MSYDVDSFMNMVIHAIAKSSADLQCMYNRIYNDIESENRFEHVEYSVRELFNIIVYHAASHVYGVNTPSIVDGEFIGSHDEIERYLLGVAEAVITYEYAKFENVVKFMYTV